uniref:BPTI/Kunitz inhibitor domain-containing protein n=1 Tax=Trichuris muris TaxID=70415 RepID=A0A5S6Q926_TRIMR
MGSGTAKEGDACNRNDTQWYPVADSDSSFLYCHPKHGLFVNEQCGLSSDGSRMVFSVEKQQCLARRALAQTFIWPPKRPSVWSSFASEARKKLGGRCSSNAHCPPNSFCDHFGICVCIPDYVEIDQSCWKRSEPTEACRFNEQCEAAWPRSTCVNEICECPNGTRVVRSSVGHLCLSPAYICIQPASSQNGIFHFNQYYYNSLTNECEPVMLKKGGVANANIFKTRKMCEDFCRAAVCLRGEPETRDGATIECSSDADCGHPHSCYKRATTSPVGICCPSRAFVCSPFGGIFMDVSNIEEPLVEYDEGLQAETAQSVNFPVIRYYFTLSELKCKAFLFRGVGGNFNNFLSYEQCFDYCMPVVCNKEKAAVDMNGRLIRCAQTGECPKSHSCVGSICCQSEDILRLAALCPDESLKIDSNGDPVSCSETTPCLPPYVCHPVDVDSGKGICCNEQSGLLLRQHRPFGRCPKNLTALVTADKGEPLRCSIRDAECPVGFFCSLHSDSDTNGICCSFPAEELSCPMFTRPKYTKVGLEKCGPHEAPPSCLLDSDMCYFNREYRIYYCCEGLLPGCPVDSEPFDGSVNASVARCSAHSNATCATPAFCFFDPTANHSICCQNKQECPNGSPSLSDENGNRLTCSNKCPTGYRCLNVGLKRDRKACCADDPLTWRCDHGRSLLRSNGDPVTCSSNSPCPESYLCTGKDSSMICCPRAEYICDQSVNAGEHCPGSKTTRAFYFDPVGKSCNGFTYSGCGGNDNRFSSIGSCEATCELSAVCPHGMPLQEDDRTRNCSAELPCPSGYNCLTVVEGDRFCCPNAEMVCNLPVDPGLQCSGSLAVENFFYDPTTMACRQFFFEGCGGNRNRFHTSESCLSFCQPMACSHGRPLTISGQVRRCSSSSDCPHTHNCSAETQVCCPRADFICTQPEDVGQTCGLPQYRYRYDNDSGICRRFVYAGYQGNANNFVEQKDCKKFCLKLSYCPSGLEPLIDRKDGDAIGCVAVNDHESCPPGYTCQKNHAGLYYCCTAPPKCYSNLDPYVQTGKSSPLSCMPGHFGFNDGCPKEYECQLNTNGEYHCCPGANVTNACPDDMVVHSYRDRQQPTKCYAADPSCPDGYTCQFDPGFGHYFCCSEYRKEMAPRKPYGKAIKQEAKQSASDFKCADGSSPYVDPYLRAVRVCNPYLPFTCPSGYACVYNPSSSNYYCCISNEILPDNVEMALRRSLACPAGLQPFINGSIGQPIICQPSLPGICPLTSICQYSPLYWQFICCTSSPQPGDNLSASSVLQPGDVGCTNDFQCSKNFPGAYCKKSVCTCPASMLLHQKSCVLTCPAGYIADDHVCELLVSLDSES